MSDNITLFAGNPHYLRKGRKLFTRQRVGDRPRFWDPRHSKLSALLIKNPGLDYQGVNQILYLGGGHGTTVSHLSDLSPTGFIYTVEFGITMDDVLILSSDRKNIIPIMEDASHPERYSGILPEGSIDLLYQDIAQRDQLDILLANLQFLKDGGSFLFMVKTRSISQETDPVKIIQNLSCKMEDEEELIDLEIIDLAPFQKDHFAILGRKRE